MRTLSTITISTTTQPQTNAWGFHLTSPTTEHKQFGIARNKLILISDALHEALKHIPQPTTITIKLTDPEYVNHIGQWHKGHPNLNHPNHNHKWQQTSYQHLENNKEKWQQIYKQLQKHKHIITRYNNDTKLIQATWEFLQEHHKKRRKEL